jgi:small subunit ribosomal protein S2
MLTIESGLQDDTYKGYTKFERVQLEKEANRLKRFFDGIKTLKSKPDCLFIVDPSREKNVIKEANAIGVPLMALIDTNADPRTIDIPIPANDDAITSIQLVVEAVAAGYKAGKASK